MSYRDPIQALEEPIDLILEGINNYDKAVKERIKSGEWKHAHLLEIDALKNKLNCLILELETIKKDTW